MVEIQCLYNLKSSSLYLKKSIVVMQHAGWHVGREISPPPRLVRRRNPDRSLFVLSKDLYFQLRDLVRFPRAILKYEIIGLFFSSQGPD
jgi:hypothetical protein